jgi:hypothetical protein
VVCGCSRRRGAACHRVGVGGLTVVPLSRDIWDAEAGCAFPDSTAAIASTRSSLSRSMQHRETVPAVAPAAREYARERGVATSFQARWRLLLWRVGRFFGRLVKLKLWCQFLLNCADWAADSPGDLPDVAAAATTREPHPEP